MLTTGLVSVTFKKESPEFVLAAMWQAGLRAVEWSENWHVPAGDAVFAAELAQKTAAQGAKVAAYGSYYRLGENENPQRAFAPVLRNAVAMRAPVLRIWAGSRPSRELTREDRAALAAEARLVSRMAADSGIKVALEWHRNTATDTNESGCGLLDEAENLYSLWQPTPALDVSARCAGVAMLEKRNKLLNLHTYYWQGDTRCPLAQGRSEWARYLAEINPAVPRYALIEFVRGDTAAQLAEDADSLRRLLQAQGLLQEG